MRLQKCKRNAFPIFISTHFRVWEMICFDYDAITFIFLAKDDRKHMPLVLYRRS